MSNRSSVRIQVYKEEFDRIDKMIRINDPSLMEFDYYRESKQGENRVVVFGWDYIKWHPDYPVPNYLESIFDRFDLEDIPYVIAEIPGDGYATQERENLSAESFKYVLGITNEFCYG